MVFATRDTERRFIEKRHNLNSKSMYFRLVLPKQSEHYNTENNYCITSIQPVLYTMSYQAILNVALYLFQFQDWWRFVLDIATLRKTLRAGLILTAMYERSILSVEFMNTEYVILVLFVSIQSIVIFNINHL